MKVELLKLIRGSDICADKGDVIEVDDESGRTWVKDGIAKETQAKKKKGKPK